MSRVNYLLLFLFRIIVSMHLDGDLRFCSAPIRWFLFIKKKVVIIMKRLAWFARATCPSRIYGVLCGNRLFVCECVSTSKNVDGGDKVHESAFAFTQNRAWLHHHRWRRPRWWWLLRSQWRKENRKESEQECDERTRQYASLANREQLEHLTMAELHKKNCIKSNEWSHRPFVRSFGIRSECTVNEQFQFLHCLRWK